MRTGPVKASAKNLGAWQMNNQEQQALIDDCKSDIKQLKQALKTWGAEWNSYLKSKLERQEIALAALTAEPVKVPDRIKPDYEAIKRILPAANPDEYACCVGADMWNACRAEVLRLNAAPVVPAGWQLVPVEPTQAMINAWLSEVADWRGHVAGYRAMLAAAPDITDNGVLNERGLDG